MQLLFDINDDAISLLERERHYVESLFEDSGGYSENEPPEFSQLDTSININHPKVTDKLLPLNRDTQAKAIADAMGFTKSTNTLLYKPNAVMSWHTNADKAGKRAYLTYSYGKSVFRYRDPLTNEIIDSHDPVGRWFIRYFDLTRSPLLWHTISSGSYRIAYGFSYN